MAGWNMEPPTPGSLDHPDLGAALNEVFTPEMREKMVRLEKENEILRRRVAEKDETIVAGRQSDTADGGGGQMGQERGPRTRVGDREGVAALQKQLREKQKRISQLEAVAQETS